MAVILNRTLQAANGVNFVNFGFTPTSGNLLLAYCAVLNSATFGTFTGAYPWTLLSAVTNTTVGFRHAIYGRVSTGNEPWFQFSIAGSASNIAALIELDPNKLDTYVSRGQGTSTGTVAGINFFNSGTARHCLWRRWICFAVCRVYMVCGEHSGLGLDNQHRQPANQRDGSVFGGG
jgi:hypothetical protein